MQHGQHFCQLCQLSVSVRVCNPGDLAAGSMRSPCRGWPARLGAGCSPVGAARHGNKGIADCLNLKQRQAQTRRWLAASWSKAGCELAGCKQNNQASRWLMASGHGVVL